MNVENYIILFMSILAWVFVVWITGADASFLEVVIVGYASAIWVKFCIIEDKLKEYSTQGKTKK